MEVTGKIILKLPLQSGTSKAGNAWSKQEYVLETLDSYPKKVHFDFFGDRINQYPLEVGEVVTLSFDIESREYQGRWFTSIRGWKAEKGGAQPAAAPAGMDQTFAGAPAPAPFPTAQDFSQASAGADNNDDLPF